MSKKQKSKQKPQPLVKPMVKPATVIHASKSSEPTPTVIPKAAPIAPVQPVAQAAVAVTEERETSVPFWARMPFAVMDFWMSQATRGDRKS